MSKLIIQHTAVAVSHLLLMVVLQYHAHCHCHIVTHDKRHLRKMSAETRASHVFDVNG